MNNLEEEKQKNYNFYSLDNNLNEKKRILFFIQGEIYKIDDNSIVIILNPLLNNIKKSYEPKNKYYILPKYIDKKSFKTFLDLIKYFNDINEEKNFELNIDFNSLRIVFNISLFFQYIQIIETLVKNYIIPQINRDNCIFIIKNYIELVYNKQVKNIFSDLIEKCFLYINKHISYFISKKKNELLELSQETIDEIIDRYFKNCYSPLNIEENKLIFWLLLNNRKINNDLFELLEDERKNAIMNFESLHSSNNNFETYLIWDIHCENLNQPFLENEERIIEGIKVKLISYFDNNNDIFNLAMEVINDDENVYDSIEKKPSYLIEKNSIISLISVCEIKEINFKSKMNFNCIFTSSKTKYLLFKLHNFRDNLKNIINENSNVKFTLHIYLSRNYIFPSILYEILKNFKDYYSLNSICNLPRSALNLIFKNDILKVESEEQKLICILNWLNGKNSQRKENSLDLFDNIDWRKINTDNLIDFLINQGKLILLSEDLKKQIFQEFQRRFQEEYRLYNMSLNESSISNSSFLISQNIKKVNENFDNNSYINFTFNFLNKIVSYLSQRDIHNTESEKKTTQSNLATNDYTKENKLTNQSQNISKNKIPYTQNSSFRRENNKYNFLVKKVSNSFKTSKILSARNLKEFPPSNKSKTKYTITNTNNSMLSNNNTSTISYKNSNTSIVSNTKIEKNIINKVLNKEIRSNTPTCIIYDKNSNNINNINKQREVKTFSINNKNKTKNLIGKSHSKSMDKTNSIINKDNINYTLPKYNISLYPKNIHSINMTSESNLTLCTKSPKNVNLYSLQNKDTNRENYQSIPYQKTSNYYKMKLNQESNNNNFNIRRINKNSASHLRSRSNH